MKAPEKLYFGESDRGLLDIYSTKESSDDIEYTRTDTFIEKACEWLEPVLKNYAGYYVGEDILRDFKKYIKGE
jgi:hypothetical protein